MGASDVGNQGQRRCSRGAGAQEFQSAVDLTHKLFLPVSAGGGSDIALEEREATFGSAGPGWREAAEDEYHGRSRTRRRKRGR